MCEFCEESKNRKDIDDNGEIKIRLNEQMGNNLEINYYHYGAKVGRYIPIAYCPMCGRLVNKYVNEDFKKKEARAITTLNPNIPNMLNPIFDTIIENPCLGQEIAKAITEAVDPTNIANSITKNIMRGGIQ